jgi:SAM-dependent methyltransferase
LALVQAQADPYFSTRLRDTDERRRLWPVLVAYLQERWIPRDAAVLDVGAGYCYFVNNVQARERHALDASETVAAYAAADVTPHVGSVASMDELEDAHFDVVFASNLLEHLPRDELERGLGEVLRVLKPGGRFLVVQPNFRHCYRSYFDDYTHVQVFTDRSLRDVLLAAGFAVGTVIPRFLPFSVESRLPPSPRLLGLYLRLPYRPFAGQMLVVAERPRA